MFKIYQIKFKKRKQEMSNRNARKDSLKLTNLKSNLAKINSSKIAYNVIKLTQFNILVQFLMSEETQLEGDYWNTMIFERFIDLF